MKMTNENAMNFDSLIKENASDDLLKILNSSILPYIMADKDNNLTLKTTEGYSCELNYKTAAVIANYYTDLLYALADADAILESDGEIIGAEDHITEECLDHTISYMSDHSKFIEFIKNFGIKDN